MKREVRTFTGAQLRAKNADKMGMTGYAAVFNQEAEIYSWPGYKMRELIKPGAFSRAISEKQDVRCLLNHDANLVLGRTKSKTLELSEDTHGLQFDCDFPDTTYARDTHAVMDRGDIDQCSFGFIVIKQTWREEKDADGNTIETREIEDVDLFDVSPVTYPAYEGTSCEARSLWPDGVPEEIEKRKAHRSKRMSGCECECPECEDGNCADCSDSDCEDENCRCQNRSKPPADTPSETNAAESEQMELRVRAVKATL